MLNKFPQGEDAPDIKMLILLVIILLLMMAGAAGITVKFLSKKDLYFKETLNPKYQPEVGKLILHHNSLLKLLP